MTRRPTRARLGTAALVIAALAIGYLLNQHLPQADASRPFLTKVSSDGVVHLRAGELQVLRVRGARSFVGSMSIDDPFRSNGVFVIVTFRWTPLRGSESVPIISHGELRDSRGRVTSFQFGSGRSGIDCPSGPYRVPSTCVAFVEADPSTLPGAHLRLGLGALDERFDSVADLDLRITKAEVRRWQQVRRVTLPATGVRT